jgi:hypothetical protein
MKLYLAALAVLSSHVAFAQLSSLVADQLTTKASDLPVFFTVPDSAMTKADETMTKRSVKFTHPDSKNFPNQLGLRLIPTKRAEIQTTLSGLVQDGDIVLSFRPEWSYTGSYPHVQMGVSHAGIIYTNNGKIYNVDNPMDNEYVGQLNSQHYQESNALHIIRPKLTLTQKKNVKAWAKMLADNRAKLYKSRITFNGKYEEPKYDENSKNPYSFVKALGAIALRVGTDTTSMFCSEFVFSLLALRDCSPTTHKAEFAKAATPSCIKPLFTPMPALGNYPQTSNLADGVGMADGPLMVLKASGATPAEQAHTVESVFPEKENLTNMSSGHRTVAESMSPMFAPLKNYYLAPDSTDPQIAGIKQAFNANMKPNYSPTGYLINSLLPSKATQRVMDYVGTIVFLP